MDSLLHPPLPEPTVLTQPFWDACRAHRLSIQRCADCRKFRFYPTVSCPHCASPRFAWETVSGRGTVYSWIVVEKTHDPYWQHRVPYICAIIELREQEGLFMPGLLTGTEPAKVLGGMPVEAIFEDASPTISLPRWRAEKAARS
jgi:uncharacterized OB-fold protein